MSYEKLYRDKAKCPKCGNIRDVLRRKVKAGKRVNTYCTKCHRMSIVVAGEAQP